MSTAADPYVPFVIDVERMFTHRVRVVIDPGEPLAVHPVEPGMTLVASTPRADKISLRVELEDRWCRHLAFVLDLVTVVVRRVQDPDVVPGIDGDTPDDAKPPLVGKRLWPGRVMLECRWTFGLRVDLLARQTKDRDGGRHGHQEHPCVLHEPLPPYDRTLGTRPADVTGSGEGCVDHYV